MDAIEGKLATINDELIKIDKDLGYAGDQRRGYKRNYVGTTSRENGGALRMSANPPGMEAYGYIGGEPKRKRESFDDRKRDSHSEGRRRDSYADGVRKDIKFEIDDEDDDDYGDRPKRTVSSTVVMPAIETKSRDQMLQELAKTEKTEVVNRNRRMFSNLMSALTGGPRRKEDVKKIETEKKQKEKIVEVERKMQEQKRLERQKEDEEKREKIMKRKELEIEMRSLTRKKALIQYAEAKKKHYEQMSNFIMTTTKPSLFFLPAKHNVRSLELLNNTKKTINNLIDLRQKELEKELEQPQNYNQPEEDDNLKSFIAPPPKRVQKEKTAPPEKAPIHDNGDPEDDDENDEGYEPDIPVQEVKVEIE